MSICEEVTHLDKYEKLDEILTGDSEEESKHVSNVLRLTFEKWTCWLAVGCQELIRKWVVWKVRRRDAGALFTVVSNCARAGGRAFQHASPGITTAFAVVLGDREARRTASGLFSSCENGNISGLEELLLILDASTAPLDEWTRSSIASSRLKRNRGRSSRGSSSSPASRLVSVGPASTPLTCS